MAELLKESKQYRVNSEAEVTSLIEEAKDSSNGTVEFSRKHKTKKTKGIISDEWWVVDITEKYSE